MKLTRQTRRRFAAQSRRLDPQVEEDALLWIEALSEFDNPTPPRTGWAEASQALAEAGDDKLVWPEFPSADDDEWKW